MAMTGGFNRASTSLSLSLKVLDVCFVAAEQQHTFQKKMSMHLYKMKSVDNAHVAHTTCYTPFHFVVFVFMLSQMTDNLNQTGEF